MNERRILAVPSTEDPSAPANRRQNLSDEYLEKALKVVEKTMDGVDPALAYKAAQWVAEMVMGKPKQEIEQLGGTEIEMARLLGAAYSEHLKTKAALPAATPDGVYILGEVVEADYHEVTEDVNNVPPTPTRTWDALPE